MSGIAQLCFSLLFVLATVESQNTIRLDPVLITNETTNLRTCPSSGTVDAARRSAKATIRQAFLDSPCGGVGWTSVALLDLGNPAQQCPTPWVERDAPQRSCTAENSNDCRGLTFPVPGTYNRVCGQIQGYSINSPDAFVSRDETIDGPYLDGVSVTYGSPRQHIWSFAAGHGVAFGPLNNRCPCVSSDRQRAPLPPAFVGENYYCDNLDNGGELWDGIDCNNACCTFHDPPVFTVSLPNPTSDGIEVRICTDQNAGDETIHIRLLQLFIQ